METQFTKKEVYLWAKTFTQNEINISIVRKWNSRYGNTGCWVFKGWIQKWKGSWLKINCSKMKPLNFADWCKVEVFWEGNKVLQNHHFRFEVYHIQSNLGWRFRKNLWPSQNVWILMGRCQKVLKSDIQSQFSTSKIIPIFLIFFPLKNIGFPNGSSFRYDNFFTSKN